jgi:DNA oxidative demethylase
MQTGLFDCAPLSAERRELLSEGSVLLRGFARAEEMALMEGVRQVLASAPFRHMVTPGGQKMSVAMTNCGLAGWVSDRRGYRYDSIDPVSEQAWPPMPALFSRVAKAAAAEAGFPDFTPDVCLINRYEPGTRLSLHQDKDERDFSAPIVSVSLGLPATFLFGGLTRSERPRGIRLESGDVVVWGGAARLTYHGIAPLADGDYPLTGRSRINLTFRKAL